MARHPPEWWAKRFDELAHGGDAAAIARQHGVRTRTLILWRSQLRKQSREKKGSTPDYCRSSCARPPIRSPRCDEAGARPRSIRRGRHDADDIARRGDGRAPRGDSLRVVPAPAHGEHSMRVEILLSSRTRSACSRFTTSEQEEFQIKGQAPESTLVHCAVDVTWARRLVAFRMGLTRHGGWRTGVPHLAATAPTPGVSRGGARDRSRAPPASPPAA